ncbi:proline--tRNA ligase [Candidatus Woesebacteria bacterium]|nr:proline--tRNA ligase [Candidatus Woesebacteria bacterium]
MKYSKLFGKSIKGDVSDSKFPSHTLLTRGGFIAESTAGRFYFLPLGWRVHDKIKNIIKEEMDRAGGQEMISPVLHPLELWKETNRTNTAGFELMTLADRRGAEFALGGTAEEMFVDVVRKQQLSYRDLPFTIYQFSTKFRDEMRSRGGLLRVREFVMKDAYSFSQDEAEFKIEYENMAKTYDRIYQRFGLETLRVEADNGYIGGEYCHEYQVVHPEGEGKFFTSTKGDYCAHEDVAIFQHESKNEDDEMAEYQTVEAKRGTTMEDGQKLHGLPMWQQLKDVMFSDEKGNLILAIIRGDLDVNEAKLLHVSGAARLESATAEQIRAIGSEPGFISPVGLKGKVKIIADRSMRTVRNFYGGANQLNLDALNMNIDRDFTADVEGDIALAQDGFLAEDGGVLVANNGIEVGNIFQLGYHYTNLMKNAEFVGEDGLRHPYYMGCYGIGLGRTLATVVEKHHDDRGIIWPESIAPFRVHLASLPGREEDATALYEKLVERGIDVLWDDRQVSPGTKFADADLIGCPIRLVISQKTGDKIEWKNRSESTVELIDEAELLKRLI